VSLSTLPSKPENDSRNGAHLSDADLFDAFYSAYRRSGASTHKLFEAAASSYAVAELLIARGIIGLEELDERRRMVEERLMQSFEQAGLTIELEHSAPDKYKLGDRVVEIDCQSRLEICKAVCCKLVFPLSRQDIEERVVQWELTRPYVIRKHTNGYCVHSDNENHLCTIYTQRPAVCRGYDCRRDTRIWKDFDNCIINPDIELPDWPSPQSEKGDSMKLVKEKVEPVEDTG